MAQPNKNKEVVVRFNKEFIEEGNMESFKELMDDGFINHTITMSFGEWYSISLEDRKVVKVHLL